MPVLAITLPIFLLIGLGTLIARRGLLGPEQVHGLGVFTINVALPALVYRLLARHRLQDVLEWRYALVYAAACFAVLIGGFLYWRRVAGIARPRAALRSYGMVAGNSAFMGLPIALQAFGPKVGIAVAITIAIENILMLPGLIILGHETAGARGRLAVLRGVGEALVRSPLVLAIAAAILSILSGLGPAGPLARALDLLGAASAPVALVFIGGRLVRLDTRDMGPAMVRIGLGKLVLLPALVGALLLLVPVASADLRHGALLMAAMPMASSFPVFGQRYGEAPLAAAALLACTAASFVTLNLMLWLLRAGWLG